MSYTTSIGLTPSFAVVRNGDDITNTIADRVISLRVSSYEGGGDTDQATLVVDDRDWNIDLPNVGDGASTLGIYLGYSDSFFSDMGTFKVSRLGLSFTPRAMTINCDSVGGATDLKAPAITSYDGKTLGEIVGAIASSASVTPAVAPALASIQLEYLNQHSGAGHLLQDLEGRFNALAKFSDGKLSFTQRGSGDSASGQKLNSVTLDGGDIAELSMDITDRQIYSHTRASYWDKEQHKLVWLNSSVAGDSVSSVPFMLKRAYNTQIEAQSAADSQQSAMNRQGCQGTLTMSKGDPRIIGGSNLTITGTRAGIDGNYIVQSAIHTLTKDGGLSTVLSFYSENGAGSAYGDGESSTSTETPAQADAADRNAPL